MQGPKGQAERQSLEDAALEIVGPDGLVPGSLAGRGHAHAFGETSDPAAYVPREATDLALSKLELSVWKGRVAALFAHPGLGKTTLLRVLEQRLQPKVRCVFLPYAALDIHNLAAWTLGLLGEPPSEDPGPSLEGLARALARDGSGLLLLIDDAGAMPIETARFLGEALTRCDGSLRVVLAATDEAAARRVMLAIDPEAVEVRLAHAMTTAETKLYLRGRLELAKAPAIAKARFGPDMVDRIQLLSGGVPRRVHELATTVLTGVPFGVGSDDAWLGGPLDEFSSDLAGLEDLEDEDLEPLVEDDARGRAKSLKRDELGFFRRLLSSD